MRFLNLRKSRLIGLLALALGATALLALSGVATAKDRGGDDNGGHHGRHHHHLRELREAGTISSFDPATGKLAIALTGGGSVTGLVTTETQIRCEGVDDRVAQRRDHGSDDNSGRGSGEPDDDHGGHGNEPGDDNGGQFEPGDDHGGHGTEPGDDNGGQFEPGDDHGGAGEPGDDHGGHGTEPGDDNGGAGEPGDDHGGRGNEPGDDNGGNVPTPPPGAPTPGAPASCGTSALVPGAFVGEAELRIGTGTAVFREIELGHHS